MTFVLLYIQEEIQALDWKNLIGFKKDPYLICLENAIKNLRLLHENPKIIILTNSKIEFPENVDIRFVKSNDAFLEKVRLLDYLEDIERCYFLDTDQVFLTPFEDFKEDLNLDLTKNAQYYCFNHIPKSTFIREYNIDYFWLACTGLIGISNNSRTKELFKLAEKNYVEQKLFLPYIGKGSKITDEPYFCLALSHLNREKDYITVKSFGKVYYDVSFENAESSIKIIHYICRKYEVEFVKMLTNSLEQDIIPDIKQLIRKPNTFVLFYFTKFRNLNNNSKMYLGLLINMINNIRNLYERSEIIVLGDTVPPLELKVAFRKTKSSNPFFEKTRLLDYVSDVKQFYYLDTDQVLFETLPEFKTDLSLHRTHYNIEKHKGIVFNHTVEEVVNAYNINYLNFIHAGVIGVTVNERTKSLYKLINSLAIEKKLNLNYNAHYDCWDDIWFGMALSLLNKNEEYLSVNDMSGIVHNYDYCNRTNNHSLQKEEIKIFHFVLNKPVLYNSPDISAVLARGSIPSKNIAIAHTIPIVLIYIKNDMPDFISSDIYLAALKSIILNLKITQDNPRIIILSNIKEIEFNDSELNIEIRELRSNIAFLEKTRLLDYVGDLEKFYYLDIDQILFEKLPWFEEDFVIDYTKQDTLQGFEEKEIAVRTTYNIDQLYSCNSGIMGVTVNEKTKRLFKLVEKHYLEHLVEIHYAGQPILPDEPYFCISISQLNKKEEYLSLGKIDYTVYDFFHNKHVIEDKVKVFHCIINKWSMYRGLYVDAQLNNYLAPSKTIIKGSSMLNLNLISECNLNCNFCNINKKKSSYPEELIERIINLQQNIYNTDIVFRSCAEIALSKNFKILFNKLTTQAKTITLFTNATSHNLEWWEDLIRNRKCHLKLNLIIRLSQNNLNKVRTLGCLCEQINSFKPKNAVIYDYYLVLEKESVDRFIAEFNQDPNLFRKIYYIWEITTSEEDKKYILEKLQNYLEGQILLYDIFNENKNGSITMEFENGDYKVYKTVCEKKKNIFGLLNNNILCCTT
jgi:hypothetical protein